MTVSCDPRFIDVAVKMADAARPVVRKYFRGGFDVESKGDQSLVTIADKETEAALRAVLAAECPDHEICGEEMGGAISGKGYQWVLDPIDGTSAFVMGTPMFGTLIALAYDGVPILGIIDQPIADERWIGALGHGTTFNGKPAKTRSCARLADAMVYTTAPRYFPEGADFNTFTKMTRHVRYLRYGAECYGFGLVASGHVDMVFEATLNPWDFAALVPVVTEAGGVMTDWDGKPLTLHADGHVIAAGSRQCHEELVELLKDVPRG